MLLVFVSEKRVVSWAFEVLSRFPDELASVSLVSKILVICCLVIEDTLC
jgi:hypothetical protein